MSQEHEPEIDQFFERPMAIDVREERLAQRMLDLPQEGVWWLVQFEDYLRQTKQYSIMLEEDPQRAYIQLARHVRKVPFAALTTLVFNQVLHNIVPLLESGQPLCPNPDTRPYNADTVVNPMKNKRPLQGNAAAFVRCLREILHQAWEDTLARITNSSHHYYPVWECFEAAHSAWMYAKKQEDFDAEQQCRHTIEDNALLALELLTHLRAEYAEDSAKLDHEPSTHGATWKSTKSADRLGWAASGNVASIGAKIGTDCYRLAEDFLELEACRGHELRAKFPDRKRLVVALEDDPRVYRYNHDSVAESPWPVARLCPAVPWLEEDVAISIASTTA